MASLPTDLVAAELAVRTAIAAKWAALPDAGVVHNRERWTGNMATYLKLIATQDAANGNKTVLRGAFVKLVRFAPMVGDSAVCKTPVLLGYELDVIYQFEDLRKDTSNSSDGFNALLMAGHHAFENDQELGYTDLTHNFLNTAEDAEILLFDDVFCHRITLSLDCEVYVNG